MNIPINSLTNKIKKLVDLCQKNESDYGVGSSWFKEPTPNEIITKWENEHNILIPETYKEWLCFTNEAQIRNTLAHFYGPDKFVTNSMGLSEDFVVIADLSGDGEQLCFSKTNGNFIWIDHGEIETISDFSDVLDEIIRILKPESCLLPKMEELLIKMAEKYNK